MDIKIHDSKINNLENFNDSFQIDDNSDFNDKSVFNDNSDLFEDKFKINSEIIINKKYDHHKKLELVKKINKIKKKEYLINIFKIILVHSQDYTENNNGIFIFLNNLDNKVYEQIENYVNHIYKIHKKPSNIINIFTSDISDTINNTDTIEIINNKNLSNHEKMIMRRKKYEEYLTQNQNELN